VNLKAVSQIVADFFANRGVNAVFVLSGGAALHLIHAMNDNPKIDCIPVNHEQTAAFAADGFARASGGLGLALATSGPGATNLVTGIAGAFYDSVPLVFLTGQVSRSRMLKIPGLRQYGFQETPFTELVRPIVKGSFLVDNPQEIVKVLQEATWLAQSGRKGPVVVDIPDDVQRQVVDFDSLEEFIPPKEIDNEIFETRLNELYSLLRKSSRPVVVLGAGSESAANSGILETFLENLGVPIVQSWGASGFLKSSTDLNYGFFGTHGSRVANFIVQNSDLVLALGCRLDTKATGSPATVFARGAKKVIVEIDIAEIQKFERLGLNIDLVFHAKVEDFLNLAIDYLPSLDVRRHQWLMYCSSVKNELEIEDFQDLREFKPNPYLLLETVGRNLGENDIVISDTGLSLPYVMESIAAKFQIRVLHDFNNTAMGWSIGAALGVSKARPDSRVIVVIGDGSLAIGLSDLSTLSAKVLGAKIVLLDNRGHGMIRQTQDQWFNGRYVASSSDEGIDLPDWEQICNSVGIRYYALNAGKQIETVSDWLSTEKTSMLHVRLDRKWVVRPQVRFGFPNEDQDPPLERTIFKRLMLQEPLPQSLERDVASRSGNQI
jgi:acetolactate synthase-1/2/3 large subunit